MTPSTSNDRFSLIKDEAGITITDKDLNKQYHFTQDEYDEFVKGLNGAIKEFGETFFNAIQKTIDNLVKVFNSQEWKDFYEQLKKKDKEK